MRRRHLALPVLLLLLAATGCSDSSDSSDSSTTTVTSLATDPADDTAEEGTSASCTADYRVMEGAVETYIALGGVAPITEEQLVEAGVLPPGYAAMDTFDLMTDGSATVVVATPGGACDGVDLSLAVDDTMASPETTPGESSCEVDRKVMEVALEAYVATGGTLPATEADLVAAGFLRVESDDYDYDGELVVAVSDRCAGK